MKKSFKKRELSNNLIKFTLLFLITILAITVGYLEYLVNEFQKFKPIASLNFPTDEWIKVDSAEVYSFDPTVSPNDKLFLDLSVTNKKPMRINIEPIIYVDIGGQILKKNNFGTMQIGINYTGSLPSYAFFATDEGQNNLKVSLLLTYFNGTFIKYENSTTDFHVLSVGDKILSEQNRMILFGIIISAAGVITASIISIIQTKLNRDEKNLTQRAWVGASQNIKLENTSHLVLQYTNYGLLPTNDMEAEYLISGTKITRMDLHLSSVIKIPNFGAIMPTMKQDLKVPLTNDQYTSLSSGKEFYIGIRIRYSYAKRQDGEYGIIYYYDHESELFLISEEWTDRSKDLPKIENKTGRSVDPHTGAFDTTTTKSLGPLDRVLTEDVLLLDEDNNRLFTPQVNQLTRIGVTIKNNQNITQPFAFLVQAQNVSGTTETLLSITGSFAPWQSLQPSVVWIPKNPGEFIIQIFVWESIDTPNALAPPVSFQITVLPSQSN